MNSPITFGPVKWGDDVYNVRVTRYGCKYPQIKGDSLQFNLIFITSFQI